MFFKVEIMSLKLTPNKKFVGKKGPRLKFVKRVYDISDKFPRLTGLVSWLYPLFSKHEIKKYHQLSEFLMHKYGESAIFNISSEFGIESLDFKIEFHFSKIDDCLLYDRFSEGEYYESEVTNYIIKNFKEGMSFMDVGANLGYFTLLSASLSETGTVWSIEANPTMYAELRRNVEINNFKNVKLFNIAAGNKKSVVKMDQKSGLYSQGTIMYEKTSRLLDMGDINVEMERLDSIVNTDLDFIKMDIEGSEGIALEGMSNLFSNRIWQNLIVEFNPAYDRELLFQSIPTGAKLNRILSNGELLPLSMSDLRNFRATVNLCVLPSRQQDTLSW